MTAADPPPPFIDLSRPRIVRRVIAAELLRQAFLAVSNPPKRTSDSIHGAFGVSAEWPQYREEVKNWLLTELSSSGLRTLFGVHGIGYRGSGAMGAKWAYKGY